MTAYTISILIGLSALSIAILILSSSYRKLKKTTLAQVKQIESLQDQLITLCEGAIGNDSRISQFANDLYKIRDQQQNFSNNSHAPSSDYDHAIRLARKGADINELVDVCGLTNEEAHLICHLNNQENRQQSMH